MWMREFIASSWRCGQDEAAGQESAGGIRSFVWIDFARRFCHDVTIFLSNCDRQE